MEDFENFDSEERIDQVEGDDEGELLVNTSSKKVLMEPKDITLFQYKKWHDQGRLNLNPDWQRAYVWRGKRPSLLIESLLMQIPIPVIFLARTDNGSYEVIDGVQRLTTAFHFMENKFCLTGMTVFRDFNEMYFKDLPTVEQSQIEDAVMTAFILSEKTSQDMLFTIFERINTGGISLNEMEIRNCIYRGSLNFRIKDMTQNKDFQASINMKNLSERMLDRSFVLRFLAFYEQGYDKASSGLKAFLNRFYEIHRNSSDSILNEFDEKFKRAMRSSFGVFGSHAFRIRREDSKGSGSWAPRANVSIFQVITTSFAKYEHVDIMSNKDSIYEAYLSLHEDPRWIDAISKSTGDFTRIKYAFEAWNGLLTLLMKNSKGLDKKRLFSFAFKKELFDANDICPLCNQRITSINDAAVDHIEQYWVGGKTIPSNARLTHRLCNMKRKRADT